MTEKSTKPQLRFAGFDDTWEQRKLSDVATMHARIGWQNLRTSEFLDSGDYMLITGTDFNDGAVNYSTCHFVEKERYEQDKHIQIKNGSILITKDGTLGKVAYVQGLSMPATLNAGVFNVEIKDETKVDNKYLFQYLKAPFLMDYVDKKATGGTIKHLNQNILVDFPVVMPSKAEQEAIGVYFQQLDNLITLHQRKYDKLTNVKKSMLEKMFPKNGSSVPEIRFKGFTDDWEQRKLGEILQERNTRTSDFESNPLYSLTIESGVTPKTDRYERSSLVTKTEDLFKIVKPNEFVTNPMNLRFGALGYNRNAFTVSVSGYYDVFSIDDDKCSGFWNSYFKTLTAMNIFDNAATGSLIEKRRVKYSTLQQLAFYMPNDLSEKAEIGKYMDTFDNLITLHQRKLEKLKLVKKSMLEKMFPKNGSSVPEIRFNGFTDDWEQRKAIDIADYSKGNGYSKGDLTDAGTPIILYGRLYTKYQFAISEVDTFAVPRNGAVYSQGNEVIVPASGETAEDIARASAVEKSGVLLGGDLNILRPFDFINPLFLALAISNGEPQKELAKKAQGKSVVHIHNTDIQEVTIAYPSRTEQDRIVSVFRQLDNLITLHQRKVEKLQIMKKSMLEKMFV